jgi:hypothetical protein
MILILSSLLALARQTFLAFYGTKSFYSREGWFDPTLGSHGFSAGLRYL